MTKEEVLNTIIEHYKNGSTSALSDYCDRVRCADCPFNTEDCVDDVAMAILDRLLKAEEHQETNLEHFRLNVVFDKANGTVHINLKNGWENNYSRPHKGAIDWLLAPYEKTKTKYKLSKFEHDLLKCYHVSIYGIKDFWILEQMQDKGYFKNIPTDVPIRDILENCEVVD